MLRDPSKKYRPFPPVALPDRSWPSARITKPPVWCSTDLRDGNQALFEPMNRERKEYFFEKLVGVGFEETRVARLGFILRAQSSLSKRAMNE